MEDDSAGLIGMDVGGYVVESELGRGGMGVVYAATHPMIGKRAAIKILKKALSNNPATVERFLQEARSVNMIGHPNIVDIFAFGTLPDGRCYLVMDLLQGEPLRKRVKRSAIPVMEAVGLLEEIASALVAAHDKGFIHRDLKPDNVFLVEHPNRTEVKLLDFGLAKLMPNAMMDRAYRTATGAMIGTPDYMSPEQLRGTGVDHRTDIYALGVMAFEFLTHSRPHRFADGTFDLDGLTFKEALMEVPGVPEEMADLIESMVARDPDERPTLVAVRAVLKRVQPDDSPMADETSVFPARAIVATPRTGVPTVDAGPPSHMVPQRLPSQPPAYSGPGYSVPPSQPSGFDPQPAPSGGYATPEPSGRQYATPEQSGRQYATPEQSGRQYATPEQSGRQYAAPEQSGRQAYGAAGLRAGSQPFLATKLGVAPAPRVAERPHPVAAARPKESKTWLVVGLILVTVASIALVVVLAS